MQESSTKVLDNSTGSAPVLLHIPLHRTFSAILAKLALVPWMDANSGFLSSLNLGYSEEEVCSELFGTNFQDSVSFSFHLFGNGLDVYVKAAALRV